MSTPVIIPTERPDLILRELTTPSDDQVYLEAYNYSREQIIEFDPDPNAKDRYLTIEEVWLARYLAKSARKLRLGMWLGGESFVGSINMRPNEDDTEAEIGYWCDTRHTGHGYTTLAARAIAGYAADRHCFVDAYVHKDNDASQRVLEKAGFSFLFNKDDIFKIYLYHRPTPETQTL